MNAYSFRPTRRSLNLNPTTPSTPDNTDIEAIVDQIAQLSLVEASRGLSEATLQGLIEALDLEAFEGSVRELIEAELAISPELAAKLAKEFKK